MAKIKGDIVIDIEKCKGCELCATACPSKTIQLSKEINSRGYHFIVKVQDNCTGCATCALVCPDSIIRVYRVTDKKEHIATISNVKSDTNVTVKS